MSRNKDKITKALKEKGYEPTIIEWTPIGGSQIMCGPEGGWYVEFDSAEGMNFPKELRNWDFICYNIREVMDEIEQLPICIPVDGGR